MLSRGTSQIGSIGFSKLGVVGGGFVDNSPPVLPWVDADQSQSKTVERQAGIRRFPRRHQRSDEYDNQRNETPDGPRNPALPCEHLEKMDYERREDVSKAVG